MIWIRKDRSQHQRPSALVDTFLVHVVQIAAERKICITLALQFRRDFLDVRLSALVVAAGFLERVQETFADTKTGVNRIVLDHRRQMSAIFDKVTPFDLCLGNPPRDGCFNLRPFDVQLRAVQIRFCFVTGGERVVAFGLCLLPFAFGGRVFLSKVS